MTPRDPSPPALARILIHLLLPREIRDEMEGDLFEGFSHRMETLGRGPARRWYLRQLLAARPLRLRAGLRSAGRTREPTNRTGLEMREWISEFRHAFRFFLRRRSAAFAMVGTIALAVAATTTVFTVVNGVLLRPLPFQEPGALLHLRLTNPAWLDSENETLRRYALELPTSVLLAEDWNDRSRELEAIGVYSPESFVYRGPEGPIFVDGASADARFFQVLGVQAMMGRTLLPEDDGAETEPAAVLSHQAWVSRFGSDPEILGKTLPLGFGSYTIVGVMPRGFTFPSPDVEFWASMSERKRGRDRGELWVNAIGRLREGASLETAQGELEVIQAELVRTYPDELEEWGVRLVPLLESLVGEVDTTLWLLLASVALTLLVACVNVANILSLLGLARRHEMAVRVAMGAGRFRLIRAVLAESFLLAGMGGLLGMGLAALALPPILGALPAEIPRRESIGMDPVVLAFGLGLILLTALLVGIIPGFQSGRSRLSHLLVGSRRTQSGGKGIRRSWNLFVVAEVSMAVVLLLGAALLGNSFARLWTVDRGFDPRGLVTMSLYPDQASHPDRNARDQLARDLKEELGSIPGLTVTAANQAPLSSGTAFRSFEIDGPEAEPREAILILSVVMDGYFRFMDIPVREGRTFLPSDRQDAPLVAVVNQAAAQALWPGTSPLGKRLRSQDEEDWITVAGVVEDVRHQALEIAPEPMVYLPAEQIDVFPATWIARAGGSLSAVPELLRAGLREVSPETPILDLQLLEEEISRSVAVPRFRTLFVCGLAGMAGLLALLGVYGVVGFSVSQRTKEIGIRMAVGSEPGDVVREVLRSGAGLLASGLVLGALAAGLATRLLGEFLFEIRPNDPLTFLATCAAVALVGLLAAYLPARRAATVDPVTVLNAE